MQVLLAVMGLILGSFYNVCIYRISREESIIFPSSHCPKCKHPLKPVDLIPVLSYILLGGRCRYCKDRISIRYPFVELITATAMLLLYYKYGFTGRFIAYVILSSILIIISFIDLDKQIIPDLLIIIGAVVAFLTCLLGWTVEFMDAILGLLLGGGILLIIGLVSLLVLKKEGMGGGDIKLMGMIGTFIGWKLTLLSLLFSIYLGGIASIFLLLFNKKQIGQTIPFGPFIACGTIVAIIWGIPILQWYLGLI